MAVAFKEWHAVCEALGNRAQDILIRKGGIHEAKGGFRFEHGEFYLFPTLFHRQADSVKSVAHQWLKNDHKRNWGVGELVEVRWRCKVDRVEVLSDWAEVQELDSRHVYTENLIRERFEWEGNGAEKGSIQVAYVKVEKLEHPLLISYEKRHGGCRSWLEI